jgi:hypothetical protein
MKELLMHQKSIAIFLFTALFMMNGCGGSDSTQNIPTSPVQEDISIKSTSTSTEEQIVVHENQEIPLIVTASKQIDILVLIDNNDSNSFNGISETKIDHFMAVTNKIYTNSTLDVKLNIKKIQPYSFSHTLSKDVLYDVYQDSNITKLKNETKSDLVVIYRKYANDGNCGVAFINDVLDKDIGYAHISLECPSTSTAHEIGHSMGLTHSEHQTSQKALFNYARGYGVEGEFATIMAYKATYHTQERVFNYSSPALNCKGYECGVDEELDNGANAVKALNYAIDYVVNFR